jgi:hypothetical protein
MGRILKDIMEYASTAHNRTVYASPPVGGEASAGTLCAMVAKCGQNIFD